MSRRKGRSAKERAAPADDRPRRQSGLAGPASIAQTSDRGTSLASAAVCGFLLLAVIAVFGQTASHDFVNFDDEAYVYENWHVQRGLTGEGTAWAITTYHAANWHPLTWLSHMLDCQLYGLKPGGHHLTNVLLHAAAAVLLFLALRRMTGGTLAQRVGGGGLRDSSPAGRVGRLGGRAQGRIERAVLHVDPLVLRPLRRAPGIVGPVLVGGGLVCPGVDGQADAGDVAVCAPLAGLLAAEGRMQGAGRCDSSHGMQRCR